MKTPAPSDHTETFGHRSDPLTIATRCEDVSRTLRLLTGVVAACNGRVLSRSFDPGGDGEMELEFTRVLCVELYCLLIATGLQLDCDSHIRLTAFCQCTRERFREVGEERASMVIRLCELEKADKPEPTSSSQWIADNNEISIYEA